MKVHFPYPKRQSPSIMLVALVAMLPLVLQFPAFGQNFFGDILSAEEALNIELNYPEGDFVLPTLADIDGDGDLDLFYSHNEFTDVGSPCALPVAIYYYENAGTDECPVFLAPVTGPFGIPDDISHIIFVDIDADGDLDLFSHTWCFSGVLTFVENTGTATSPDFGQTSVAVNPFGLNPIDIASPSLVFADMDNDGDYDAFINGRTLGHFQYQENIGTATEPSFAPRQQDPFGLSLPATPHGPIRAALADWDCDGDVDIWNTLSEVDLPTTLYIGYFHENKFNELGYTSFAPGTLADEGIIISTQGDLDGDGDLDGMASEFYGKNISSYCVTLPVAAYTYDYAGPPRSFTFTNESIAKSTECNPVQWSWDFGDGTGSQEEHPTHSFSVSEQFNVCLTVEDVAGSHTFCEVISIPLANQETILNVIHLYPSPASNYLYLSLDEGLSGNTVRVEVYDTWGRLFKKAQLGFAGPAEPVRIHIADLPDGMYLVKVANGGQFFVGEFVKMKR